MEIIRLHVARVAIELRIEALRKALLAERRGASYDANAQDKPPAGR